MQKIVFLTLLFVSSFGAYLIGFRHGQPETFNSSLIPKTNNGVDMGWMDDLNHYIFGKYFVMCPNSDETSGAFAIFYEGGFPFFMVQDMDKDGFPDELVIKDSKGKSVAVTFDDNEFDVFETFFLTVSGKPNLDAVTYIDKDFDGKPDMMYSDKEGIIPIQ